MARAQATPSLFCFPFGFGRAESEQTHIDNVYTVSEGNSWNAQNDRRAFDAVKMNRVTNQN